jgi:hypothetical protein
LNNEIGRHKNSQKKLDEAVTTIEKLKNIVKVTASSIDGIH